VSVTACPTRREREGQNPWLSTSGWFYAMILTHICHRRCSSIVAETLTCDPFGPLTLGEVPEKAIGRHHAAYLSSGWRRRRLRGFE